MTRISRARIRWLTLMFLSMAQTSCNLSNGTNAKDNMKATETTYSDPSIFNFGYRHITCTHDSMSLFNRIVECHSQSRPTFVLVTEFVAFVATMVTMLGMAVLFSFFQ